MIKNINLLKDFFSSKSDYSLISHIHSIKNVNTPLNNIFKGKFLTDKHKFIGKSALSISAIILFSQLANDAYKKEMIFNDEIVKHYITKAKKANQEFKEKEKESLRQVKSDKMYNNISAGEKKSALIEYNNWVKSNHSIEDDFNKESPIKQERFFTDVNKKQFLYTLKDLKNPSILNVTYYQEKYNNRIPSLTDLEIIAKPYGLDHHLLSAVLLKESRGDANATSHKGARGAFQILPETASEFGLKKNSYNNGYASADTAARYLLWIHKYTNGSKTDFKNENNLKFTLAGYNAGISRVKKGDIRVIPNYTETKEYIRDIMLLYKNEGHYVKKNESIYEIARLHKTTSENIILSNIDKLFYGNESLKAGDILDIREKSQNGQSSIIVKKGFNLWRLAKTLNIEISDITKVNENLENIALLKIGDTINLPSVHRKEIKNKSKNKNIR
jgi:soluble lytic murein transglycosylase-like protein